MAEESINEAYQQLVVEHLQLKKEAQTLAAAIATIQDAFVGERRKLHAEIQALTVELEALAVELEALTAALSVATFGQVPGKDVVPKLREVFPKKDNIL